MDRSGVPVTSCSFTVLHNQHKRFQGLLEIGAVVGIGVVLVLVLVEYISNIMPVADVSYPNYLNFMHEYCV